MSWLEDMAAQARRRRRDRGNEKIDLTTLIDDSHRTSGLALAISSPLARHSRPTLPDQGEEEALQHAESQLIGQMIELGHDPISARRVVVMLTRSDVRHEVQTILDLTPIKR